MKFSRFILALCLLVACEQAWAEVNLDACDNGLEQTTSYPDDEYSYYSPGIGTRGIETTGTDAGKIQLFGCPLPFPIAVASDVGQSIIALEKTGKVRWNLPSTGIRSVAYVDNKILLPVGNYILVHDAATGKFLYQSRRLAAEINFVRAVNGVLVIGYTEEQAAQIHVFEYRRYDRSLVGRDIFSDVQISSYSRDADFDGKRLAVADTFNHRVYVVDTVSRQKIFETGAYYPNQVKLAYPYLYMLAEHANRLIRFNLINNTKEVMLSCPNALFADPEHSVEEIMAGEADTVAEYPASAPYQVCSKFIAGTATLYAPNGFYLIDQDDFMVADTDNHRVIRVRQGKVITEVIGFNNPVKLAPMFR